MSTTQPRSDERRREKFFTMARRQLGTLFRFVRHELRYRRDNDELTDGELSPEDVVDAVLLRAYREYVDEPGGRRSAGWLIRLAQDQIESDVERLRALREEGPHIEEDVPESPPQQEVSTLGEETLFFYQPDEDLTLEDMIPDARVASPEQLAQGREQLVAVRKALQEMPGELRRALLLRQAEGLSTREVAQAIGRPPREVEAMLQQARGYLRERLVEAGYPVSPMAASPGPIDDPDTR